MDRFRTVPIGEAGLNARKSGIATATGGFRTLKRDAAAGRHSDTDPSVTDIFRMDRVANSIRANRS